MYVYTYIYIYIYIYIVDGEGWQEKVDNREEWKKLLRTARNRRILDMPME